MTNLIIGVIVGIIVGSFVSVIFYKNNKRKTDNLIKDVKNKIKNK